MLTHGSCRPDATSVTAAGGGVGTTVTGAGGGTLSTADTGTISPDMPRSAAAGLAAGQGPGVEVSGK
jgi:hypothetical protein